MKFLLDTNTCIDLLNGRHPSLARKIARVAAKDIGLSSVVWFELMFRAAKSNRQNEVEHRLRAFAQQLAVVPFTDAASEAAATIRADLQRSGTPIGAYDILIAGHALATGNTLVTHNAREFKRVAKLRTVDWLD